MGEITRTASFDCVIKIRATEHIPLTRDVSVSKIKGESKEASLKRLEDAAKKLKLPGCYQSRFTGFKATAEEAAAALKKPQEIVTPTQTPQRDLCANEWKNRPVCKK